MSSPKIVMLGAGNVGYHLSQALEEVGCSIVQVYSRTIERAKHLAETINTDYCTNLSAIYTEADLYFLAVPDDQILPVAQQLKGYIHTNALIVHCSGATPGAVFADLYSNYGVFYPLQSFSIEKSVHFQQIPICIYANKQEAQQLLEGIARKISRQVHLIDDKQRAILHVAAVFVNNFSNYLFHIGQDILEQEAISFELLKPLIQMTVDKIQNNDPKAMQTGPASRGDQATIQQHLDYLEKRPEYQKIYQLLTQGILNNHTSTS